MKLDSTRSQPSPRKSLITGSGATKPVTHSLNGSLTHRPTANGGGHTHSTGVLKKNTRPLGSVKQSSITDVSSSTSGSGGTKFPPLTTPKAGDDPSTAIMFTGIAGSALTVPPPKPPPERQPLIERITNYPEHHHHHYSNGLNNGVLTSREKATESTLRRNASSPRRLLGSTAGSAKSEGSKHQQMDDSSLATKDREIKQLKDAHSKDMREAHNRERDLKDEIRRLQEEVERLHLQVVERDKTIAELQQQIQLQEEKYKELYERECSRHKETQSYLGGVKKDLEKTRSHVEQLTRELEVKVKLLTAQMEKSLAELRAEKDKEISIRDEKLTKLKKQMAEALKGNSWERQQQLDELSKELTKVQEECEMLKIKLRATQKAGKGGASSGANDVCMNCEALKLQLTAAQNTLKQKDQQINSFKHFFDKKGPKG